MLFQLFPLEPSPDEDDGNDEQEGKDGDGDGKSLEPLVAQGLGRGHGGLQKLESGNVLDVGQVSSDDAGIVALQENNVTLPDVVFSYIPNQSA